MENLIYRLHAPQWNITLQTFDLTYEAANSRRQTLKKLGLKSEFVILPEFTKEYKQDFRKTVWKAMVD